MKIAILAEALEAILVQAFRLHVQRVVNGASERDTVPGTDTSYRDAIGVLTEKSRRLAVEFPGIITKAWEVVTGADAP